MVRSRGARLTVVANGCPRANAGFARSPTSAEPLVDGAPVSLDAALVRAAAILDRSRQPLLAGLGTDVQGMRAALALAERCGAIVDHMHGAALAHNVRTLQSRGGIITTLGEVRNRADLIVLVGLNVNDNYQNLLSRHLAPADALQPERLSARRLVYLGPRAAVPRATAGLALETLACPADSLAATVNALHATLRGRRSTLRGKLATGIKALAAALGTARYAVFLWAPGQLDPAHGDLTASAIADLIETLNQHGRAAGLALGGDDGSQSALAACSWLTGFPLQVGFGGGTLSYDPIAYRTPRLLAQRAVDALVWISTFSARPAPDSPGIPQIVIGQPGLAVRPDDAVYLPAGTPGLDHAGELIRTDAVVCLPLRKLRAAPLPSVAEVLALLASRLGGSQP